MTETCFTPDGTAKPLPSNHEGIQLIRCNMLARIGMCNEEVRMLPGKGRVPVARRTLRMRNCHFAVAYR